MSKTEGKSIVSVYLDDMIKELINKEVAEYNLAHLNGKRLKVSNVIEDIIVQHYLRKQSKQTLILGGKGE